MAIAFMVLSPFTVKSAELLASGLGHCIILAPIVLLIDGAVGKRRLGFRRRNPVADRRGVPQVDNNGMPIFLWPVRIARPGHQMTGYGAPVRREAVPEHALDIVIAPIAKTGFFVGRQVH